MAFEPFFFPQGWEQGRRCHRKGRVSDFTGLEDNLLLFTPRDVHSHLEFENLPELSGLPTLQFISYCTHQAMQTNLLDFVANNMVQCLGWSQHSLEKQEGSVSNEGVMTDGKEKQGKWHTI